MQYVEIYADDKGVSHFRDVEIRLTRAEIAPPALPVGLSEFRSATNVGFFLMPSGWVGDWHQPPSKGFVFMRSGEVQIEVGDGETRQFQRGSVWLHQDRKGRGHHTRVVGDEDVELVMIMLPDE